MSILPILTFPDPRLRRPALPVAAVTPQIRQLAADMLETMYAAPGRGLAGPQVGVMVRLFVMDCTWRDGPPTPRVCLNPQILEAADALIGHTEGCLSIPGLTCDVRRPAWITLRWSDLDGNVQTERLEGFAATCAQHELDHLNGRLCIDLLGEAARVAASPVLAAMGSP
ncbi:MAG: peptide deformylase [Pararhodobacter sp.]